MKRTTYASDFTDVNFGILKSEGWIDPRDELPSPNSYKEVLIISQKHGYDVECTHAAWMPKDGYTSGDFLKGKHVLKLKSVFLWRRLDFIPILK